MLTRSTPKTVSEMKRIMKNKMMKTIMAVAAFALAIGNGTLKASPTVGDYADNKYRGGVKHTQYLGKLPQDNEIGHRILSTIGHFFTDSLGR
jgi:hypothetical protein